MAVFSSAAFSDVEVVDTLSKPQAVAVVTQEMALAKAREKQRLDSILAVPALREAAMPKGAKRTIMRRVAHKPWPVKAVTEPIRLASPWTEEQKAAWRDSRPRYRTLLLSATVFDRKITELVWRKNDEAFTILSNVDFNFLTVTGGFEENRTQWSTCFFVHNVDSQQEQRVARIAAAKGRLYIPNVIPDASLLMTNGPDYLIYAEDEAEIPEELIEELDAVHRHYTANAESLKIAWQNRETLNAARQSWLEANPPKPRDTVINFWPVRSRDHGNK